LWQTKDQMDAITLPSSCKNSTNSRNILMHYSQQQHKKRSRNRAALRIAEQHKAGYLLLRRQQSKQKIGKIRANFT